MKRPVPPPRGRPSPAAAARGEVPAELSGNELLALAGRAAACAPGEAAPPVDAGQAPAARSGQDWRARLGDLVQGGALTATQETELHRLFREQEARTREAMQQLLAELQPHFDTGGEAAAKERFVEALRAMKQQQEAEVARLLQSLGLEGAPGRDA